MHSSKMVRLMGVFLSFLLGFTLYHSVSVHACDPNSVTGKCSVVRTSSSKVNATQKKTTEQPTIHIDEKGMVRIVDKDGTIKTKEQNVNHFLERYRFIIAGISGVGTVSMILFFILGFMRLGATSANSEERRKTITGLFLSGVAAAGLGAVTLITGLFMNAF